MKGEEVWEKVADKLIKGLNIKNIETIAKKNIKDLLIEFTDKIFNSLFSQVSADFFIYVQFGTILEIHSESKNVCFLFNFLYTSPSFSLRSSMFSIRNQLSCEVVV